ncbi:MAG: CHRD domain-containing protein [Comamonadaceae bacterium]|nr:MAG: CHRD domain-containing protein [Comamonadaceae bacterium]
MIRRRHALASLALLLGACASHVPLPPSPPLPTGPVLPEPPPVPGVVATPIPVPSPVPAPSADPFAHLATFTTRLAGTNEVPAVYSMGTGTLDAVLDTRSGLLRWKMSHVNLSGPVTAAHFHGPAEVGFNAPPVLTFAGPVLPDYEGRATLTPAQMADLRAGRWYANLHTARHPDGELRGQLIERR